MIRGRTGEVEQIKKGEQRRTGVGAKHDDGKHQDDPILVRTQDPSPPDHNTVGENILGQIPGDSPSRGSFKGCPQMMI